MNRTYELKGSEREDGSIYLTCEALPGFHYILAKGDDIETTLLPAFREFLALYLSARIKKTMPTFRPIPQGRFPQRGFTAEVEFA
jgi:hypothetical protein